MNRRIRAGWALAVMVAACLVAALLTQPRIQATSSALSASSGGWLAARRYLEERGVAVEISGSLLGTSAEAGGEKPPIWVLSFPWQVSLAEGELDALGAHLRSGGTVVAAYSDLSGPSEEQDVLAFLGLETRTVRGAPPLAPLSWWSYRRETWDLAPGDGWSGGSSPPELVLPAVESLPRAPAEASVLYSRRLPTGESGVEDVPVVFGYSRREGRVLALPAAVLSNAYLLQAGHADFLESLRLAADADWKFDEYHHGFVDPGVAGTSASAFAWDLFMVHLAVFYVLGLLAVARRFGPAWREAAVTTGSTSSFLRNLGALHRQLRHHQAAARLLSIRSRELDPSLPELPVPDVESDGDLLGFARRSTLLTRRAIE